MHMVSTQADARERIRDLLSEGIGAALERERTTFDREVGQFGRSLVLFGAGRLGRKTLTGLRRLGIEPITFADSNASLWGKAVDGLKVVSPREARARHGETAAFVVTIWCGEGWDRMKDRVRSLRDLGCKRV